MHKVAQPLVLIILCFFVNTLFAQDKHLVDSLSTRLKVTSSDTAGARLCFKLMKAYVDVDSTKAVNYAEQGIKLAKRCNALNIIADIENNLGTFYNYRGNRIKSDSLINDALRLRFLIKDSVGAACSLMNLGHNQYDQNNFPDALSCYLKAARIRHQINDQKGLAGSYIWIGNVYHQGVLNLPKALEYYDKALIIYKRAGDEMGQSYAFSNMGSVYMDQKDYRRALKYNLDALRLKEKLNNIRGVGDLLNNIGNVYFYSGKLDQSLLYYYRSLQIRKDLGNQTGIATSYLNIANVYLSKNNPSKAEPLLHDAVRVSKTINFKEGLRDGYLSLFEIAKKRKHYEKAIEYHLSQDSYKDSILNENSVAKLAELQTKYETEKKEQRINLLNKQTLVQQLQISNRNNTIVIISTIFIVLSILSYLFYNRYKLQQQAILQTAVIKQQDLATKGIIDAEENERRRIAGDLHDGVGQLLSATRMNLDTLLERLKLTDPANLDLAAKTMAMVDEGCREVRTIAHQMMPNVLLKMGLVSALRDFVNKIESQRLKISLETTGLANRLDNNVEIVLYRVIQETVNNVIKHAHASMLDVQLMLEGHEITATIEDNGVGFDSAEREQFEGIGLKNIIKRVEYLKGTVDISSSPGMGTLVAILIPLTNHEQH